MIWNAFPTCNRFPNQMENVSQFISDYMNKNTSDLEPITLIRTASGSINDNGVEGSFKAKTIPPSHPRFRESVEPIIYPLVEFFNAKGFITYTSCEGHVIRGEFHEAHVGILYFEGNDDLIDRIRENCSSLTIYRHFLDDSGDSTSVKTLEFYFHANENEELKTYHDRIMTRIAELVKCSNLV